MIRKIVKQVILVVAWSISSGALASLTGCLGFVKGGLIGLVVIIMVKVGMMLIDEWVD